MPVEDPVADESYHFDQLVREMVVSQLKDDLHAPARAAEIARSTIVAGVQGTKAAGASQEAQESVRQICHGVMAGILLIEKNLPDAAVALLQNLADAAQQLHIDPTEMMTWAMEGISRIAPTTTPTVLGDIQDAIDEKFMGAGGIFNALCAKASKKE